MIDSFHRWTGQAAVVALAMLVFSAPSAAQTLSFSFVGSVFNCSDPGLNQSIDVSFASSGTVSGSNTLITVGVGGESFDVPIATEDVDAIIEGI
jgi:hypothetical protein